MIRKAVALFRLYAADVFAYKAAAVIWVLADMQTALLMPFVWSAVGGVAGMGPGQTVAYYVAAMCVSQFVTCHLLWDIAVDIREGAFSSQLLRPVSYLFASFVRNVAWRLAKAVLFVPVVLVLLPLYGRPDWTGLRFGPEFVLSAVLGQVLAFAAAYCMALVTLWTTEFISIFQVYYFPELLLSGRVVPLGAFPPAVQGLAGCTHFRYTVAFPVEVLFGKASGGVFWAGIGAQVAWTLVFLWLGRVLFRAGVRRYAGFGA
ncbi:MAG: ABC-2 family transporter protein [Armatimonadetes bacterium]|nr:ABC-2 family transporter protein [Armatimonadota bacterium]